ncbi:MAG: hypothetical protein ABI277_13665 [Burkholderiaceae bacterium]
MSQARCSSQSIRRSSSAVIGASPHLFHVRAAWNFEPGATAIAVLAAWFRRATEQVATAAGADIGGLLDVSFDSIAELVLALFVLADGKVELTADLLREATAHCKPAANQIPMSLSF